MRSSELFIMLSLCKRAASLRAKWKVSDIPSFCPSERRTTVTASERKLQACPVRDQQAVLLLPGGVWEEPQHLCLTYQ